MVEVLWWPASLGRGAHPAAFGLGGRSQTPLRAPLGHPRGVVLGASEPGDAGVSHRESKAPVRSAF